MRLINFLAYCAAVATPVYGQIRNPKIRPKVVKTETPAQLLAAARNEILSIIEGMNSVGPKFVRLAFHDCVGGCDGCVDLLNLDNFGLEVPIGALDHVVASYAKRNVTRADIWALAAHIAADVAQQDQPGKAEYSFDWYGRPTCETINTVCFNEKKHEVPCSATRGPHRELPSPNLDTHGVLKYFDETFGLDAEETTILMGVHSLGRVQRTNSGFLGAGWDNTPLLLDNEWYHQLVGTGATPKEWVRGAPSWKIRKIDNTDNAFPNRFQWTGGKVKANATNPVTFALNTDMAFVRDFSQHINAAGKVNCTFKGPTACPIANATITFMNEYAENNTLWLLDFRDVFTFMLEFPFPTKDACTPPKDLCFIGDLKTVATAKLAVDVSPAASPFVSPTGFVPVA